MIIGAGFGGGGQRAPVSDPDGVTISPLGDLAIDDTTGVLWLNEDGGTSWWPVRVPPSRGFTFEDHLMLPSFPTLGTLGSATVSVGADQSRPGLRTYSMAAAGLDGGAIHYGQRRLLMGGGRVRARIACRMSALSDGVDNLIVRAGSFDRSTVGVPRDGVFLEYDLAGNGNGNWWLVTVSNNSPSRADTGVAAVASSTSCTILDVSVNAAGSLASARIDGVPVTATLTTTIPTGPGRESGAVSWLAYKQLGSGVLTATVDWIAAYQVTGP
jgi:hypothetical protein